MVLQYANHGEYLKNNFDSLQWSDKIRMAQDLACGLKCLHSRKIIHRDLVIQCKLIYHFNLCFLIIFIDFCFHILYSDNITY